MSINTQTLTGPYFLYYTSVCVCRVSEMHLKWGGGVWSEAKGLCGKVRERGAASVRVAFPSAAGSICYYYHSRSAWAVIIVTTESARRLLSNYLKHHKDGRNAGTTLPFSVRGEMKAMSSVGCRDFNLKTRPNCWAKSQGGASHTCDHSFLCQHSRFFKHCFKLHK